MDYEKKIQNLQFENEFLQQQIEELNELALKTNNDLPVEKEVYQSEGWLRSQIACNIIELEQIQYNMAEAIKKADAIDRMNEALENDLLISHKARQKDKATIKELTSAQIHINIMNEELDQTSLLYKKVKTMKSEYAELKSEAELATFNNQLLTEQLNEANALLRLYKNKIPTNLS